MVLPGGSVCALRIRGITATRNPLEARSSPPRSEPLLLSVRTLECHCVGIQSLNPFNPFNRKHLPFFLPFNPDSQTPQPRMSCIAIPFVQHLRQLPTASGRAHKCRFDVEGVEFCELDIITRSHGFEEHGNKNHRVEAKYYDDVGTFANAHGRYNTSSRARDGVSSVNYLGSAERHEDVVNHGGKGGSDGPGGYGGVSDFAIIVTAGWILVREEMGHVNGVDRKRLAQNRVVKGTAHAREKVERMNYVCGQVACRVDVGSKDFWYSRNPDGLDNEIHRDIESCGSEGHFALGLIEIGVILPPACDGDGVPSIDGTGCPGEQF